MRKTLEIKHLPFFFKASATQILLDMQIRDHFLTI